MMDKKDAIDYLLYMKHDVLANSPYDVALDTAIEALKETAKKPKTVRHGRWLSLEGWFNKSSVKCSVCGNTLNMGGVNAGRGDANFCPNCGADMKEEGADNG